MWHPFPPSRVFQADREGFSLLELLVVLATISLLGLTLFPVLGNTAERSVRSACLNNLRQLGARMTVYAADNNGLVMSARSASVQIALEEVEGTGPAAAGLDPASNPVWTCPNRPQFPIHEAAFNQWIIGYQYFGGISTWKNPNGTFPSRSPVNLGNAAPHWTLAADPIMKVDLTWGGGMWAGTAGMPQHHGSDSMIPQGGNQVFVDGSAQWIRFENMFYLHSWDISGTRLAYFFQDPKDFDPAMLTRLDRLRARP